MPDMPRPRPPFLHRQVTQHGKVVWYVRKGKGARIRIKADLGTAAFQEEYESALAGTAKAAKPKTKAGTLAWLVERYRDSSAWQGLALATRRQRENILRKVLETGGHQPYAKVTRKTIVAGRERRQATPSMARHFVDTMRGLFQWALDAELVDEDPTHGVKTPTKATEGHHTWTEEELATFEARWPLVTRERVAFDVLLYTGLRRGDAVRYGRPHVDGGKLVDWGNSSIQNEKTGEWVYPVLLPPLVKSLKAGPVGDLTFIAGERGRPMTKEAFGNWFGEVCRKTGVPGSAHGLRKAGATRAANNAATVAQLEAMFGWKGGGMASLYTRKANRMKLATDAASKMLRTEDEQSIPSPDQKVRARARKTKQ